MVLQRMSNSAKWWSSLRMIWGSWGPGFQTSRQTAVCPKALLRCLGGRKTAQEKKNKFLGTGVPRNFSDQCSLDFAYFLCLFSGRRSKSSQEPCSWELFFLILGGFSPSECLENQRERGVTRPHRARVAQNRILGPKNTRSVTSRSVSWRSLSMVVLERL